MGNVPPPPARLPVDLVSVWALVAALACVAPVGLLLGLVGLRRTRGRSVLGRPFALLAVVLSLVALATVPVALLGSRWLAGDLPSATDVTAGDCIDLGQDNALHRASCTEEHAAEVAGTGRFDEALARQFHGGSSAAILCEHFLSDAHTRAARTGRYAVGLLVDTSPSRVPDAGDALVCYLADIAGEPLRVRIGEAT